MSSSYGLQGRTVRVNVPTFSVAVGGLTMIETVEGLLVLDMETIHLVLTDGVHGKEMLFHIQSDREEIETVGSEELGKKECIRRLSLFFERKTQVDVVYFDFPFMDKVKQGANQCYKKHCTLVLYDPDDEEGSCVMLANYLDKNHYSHVVEGIETRYCIEKDEYYLEGAYNNNTDPELVEKINPSDLDIVKLCSCLDSDPQTFTPNYEDYKISKSRKRRATMKLRTKAHERVRRQIVEGLLALADKNLLTYGEVKRVGDPPQFVEEKKWVEEVNGEKVVVKEAIVSTGYI